MWSRVRIKNLNRLSLAYISALLVIALITMSRHYVADSIIEKHIAITEIIESNTQQKFLAEKISNYADRYALGDVSAGKLVIQQTTKFEVNQNQIKNIDMSLFLNNNDIQAIRNVRFEGNQALNKIIDKFVSGAYRINVFDHTSAELQNNVVLLREFHRKVIGIKIDKIISVLKAANSELINRLKFFEFWSIIAIWTSLIITGFSIFRPMVRNIQDHVACLEHMANTDQLTGLYNLHKFRDAASIELLRATENNLQTCLLMIDIDNFKAVNDNYGHMTGDHVIKRFAQTMQSEVRTTDIAARVGGEEFAIILVNTDPRMANSIAERIRNSIYVEKIDTDKGPISVSVSIGLACIPPNANSIEGTMKEADDALYIAKRNGRNQTVLAKSCYLNQTHSPNHLSPILYRSAIAGDLSL